MKKKVLFSMLLLFVGVSMQAQSIASEQMDERFNDGTKFPRGWFGEGWKVENGKAKAKAPFRTRYSPVRRNFPLE